MLLTVTPWWDRRQWHRQGPALVDAGHEVVYMAGDPGCEVEHRFTLRPLSLRQLKMSRLTGGLNLFGRIVRERPAVVQLCSVELLPVGLAIKLLTRIKVIYDCREDMGLSMLHKARWPMPVRRLMSWCTRVVEYLGARTFDGMIVSDPAIFRIHHVMPDERKVVFYNVPNLSLFKHDYQPLVERQFDVVLMASIITVWSGVATFLEAIGLLARRDRRVSVQIIGRPDVFIKPKIDELISEYNLAEQIMFTGRIMHDKVPTVLSQTRIGVVPMLDKAKARRNIACKAFEYMACGMPVISSDLPPERLFIKDGINGLFVPPEDATALADKIAELLDDLPRAEKLGAAGRDDIERQWNCERNQEEMVALYDRILQARPRWKRNA